MPSTERRPGRAVGLILAGARHVGSSRPRAILIMGLVGFAGSVLFGLSHGPAQPAIHDEFSYVLAADTYASGRLTNPPHPHWEHFETFHVLVQPSYQSKYPPGQGLLLALGLWISEEPGVAVWLSAALLAGALTWALLVWLPAGWGILIALMAVAQLSWFTYWAQSLWGGNLAAIGGALLLGGVGVLLKEPRRLGGIAAGAGMALLLITRPFEGAVLSVALLAGLAWSQGTDPTRWHQLFRRGGVIAGGLILAATFVWHGYYNQQVTGSVTTLPYQVYEEQYAPVPPFLFQTPRELPSFRHDEIERFWLEWGLERHAIFSATEGLAERQVRRLWVLLTFFLGPGIIALGGLVLRRPLAKGARVPAFAGGLVLAGVLVTLGAYPHYAAPAAAAMILLAGVGLCRLHRWAIRRRILDPAGFILFAWTVLIFVQGTEFFRGGQPPLVLQRDVAQQVMSQHPGPHLVLVEYGPNHNYHQEWVYNRADIAGSEIVWARSMGEERDRRLREYFSDRMVWTLSIDEEIVFRRHAPDEGLELDEGSPAR